MKFGGSTSIVDLELAAGKKKLVLGVAALKIDDRDHRLRSRSSGTSPATSATKRWRRSQPLVKPGSYVNDLTGSVVFVVAARA